MSTTDDLSVGESERWTPKLKKESNESRKAVFPHSLNAFALSLDFSKSFLILSSFHSSPSKSLGSLRFSGGAIREQGYWLREE
ncbi:unnamed protein product [Caenorhabditis nigoni]